jgi:hypothetical protein
MNPDLVFGSHEQVVFPAEQGVAYVPTKLGLAKDVPSNLVPELVLSRSDKFDMTLEVEILTENLERLRRRPQSFKKDRGKKAEAESPSNLDCTPDYIQGRTKVVSLTVAARSV